MKELSRNQRITSIDALRAFALLGILLVHTSQLFNYDNYYNEFSYFTDQGLYIKHFILLIFEGKCKIIFSILFGVSFYLILRNPNYSINRFRWRCCLLILFGLINKIIFTTDILCWYGINGLFLSLLPIRRIKPVFIFFFFILLFILSMQPFVDLGNLLFPNAEYTQRYLSSYGIKYVLSYSKLMIIKEDIHLFWSQGTLTLSYFVFGYYLGFSGRIENIQKYIHTRMVVVMMGLSFLFFILFKYSGYLPYIHMVYNFVTALFYSVLFLYIYNKIGLLKILDNYGRLGLTNYSTQNWLPILFFICIFHPLKISIEYLYLFSLFFYITQILFSNYWLKRYKYGPLEFCWRIATNLKWSDNKK